MLHFDPTLAGPQVHLRLDHLAREPIVQASCALVVGADYLVTRNHRDFRRLTIPAVEPGVTLSLLARGSSR